MIFKPGMLIQYRHPDHNNNKPSTVWFVKSAYRTDTVWELNLIDTIYDIDKPHTIRKWVTRYNEFKEIIDPELQALYALAHLGNK